MSHRTKVKGTRSATLWLLVFIAVVLVVGIGVGALFLLPQLKERQALEKHYQAGVAFKNAGEWEAARSEYMLVIALDANYQDVQARLAEVKAKLEESAAAATAVAVIQAEQAQTHIHATATTQAQATATAQANAQATAAAAPTATAEALETHYQKGLANMNLGQWENAKAELEAVFEADPNYKDVQAKLVEVEAEIARLVPTSVPTPASTPTPIPTPTPEIDSPSIQWLGFVGDQVSPVVNGTGPDGNSDGVFELVLSDVGWVVVHILLATPGGGEHWDTDGQESWILGVIEEDSGQRLDKLGTPMDYKIEKTVRLRLYASVANSGFRPGQKYKVAVRFTDGYLLEVSIQIP